MTFAHDDGSSAVPDRDWEFVERREVSDHRIFRLMHDQYRLAPETTPRDYVVLDAPDWVNIIAVTQDEHVVFVRQFRHGVREVTLEVPGGMVDPGEEPEDAALRELREESGYSGDQAIPLGCIYPNPAIQNNRCFSYLVPDAKLAGAQQPDPYERIEVVTHPLAEVPGLIAGGEISHTLVVTAFSYFGIAAQSEYNQ